MSLPVSRLVSVSINLSPLAAATRSFGILMIAGDSDVINGVERYRSYESIDEVAADFGTSAPEYLGAELYFGQSPQPAECMIARWLRTASSGINEGGILNKSQQAISGWTPVTSGGFSIAIDGTVQNLTGLNFSGVTNLNGVASVITAALSGATCIWNGSMFEITSSSTGAGAYASGTITLGSNPSYGVQASGTITLSGQPTNGDTVVIDGTTVTFVTGTPSGNQVQISAVDDAHTSANLQTFLQNSSDENLSLMTYNTIGLVTTITSILYGTAGNAYTLTKSGSNIAVSGSGNLAGGVAADTLTVNGTVFTFVQSSPSSSQILVGPTNLLTAVNINTVLNASVVSGVAQARYSVSGSVVTVTDKTIGTGGNSFTLSKSSSHISLSGATLSGGVVASSVGYATSPGSGTDISAQLLMTSSLATALIPGFNSETPVQCATVLDDLTPSWYGLTFAASVQPTDQQNLDVCTYIEATSISRIFGVTIVDTGVLSALDTTDLASLMMAAGYKQSFNQYSENAYAICSFFGRAFSVDFTANSSTITLMYKQEPSVIPENLSSTQADVLESKRCNVFAEYVNNTAIIQYGTMSGPAWFDEIHGLDWFQDAVQTACYNLLYTSTTKIPQTDSGVNQFVNAISAACQSAVNNGLVAPGVWNGPAFGQIVTGQYLKAGYYVFAQPIALQSQGDRDARISPPITVALKLAGAIQSLNVLVNVNR